MRIFNTSGPCNPEIHYTLMRESLIEKGKILVEGGRYFTLFAPRQAGKTTYFQLLMQELEGLEYTPIWISFEGFKNLTRAEFYQALTLDLQDEFARYDVDINTILKNQIDLRLLLQEASKQVDAIVLVIDEFEDIPEVVLDEIMHTFRSMYQKRYRHKLQSLILVGVSTIAELILSTASPFNVADELRLPYFTFDEIESLIQMYVTESGQCFETEVIQGIYDNTQGQPGLVNALCYHLVTEVVTDRTAPVTFDDFFSTLNHFMTDRFDKNIINIIQKANEKRDFMLRVLFSDNSISFRVSHETIAYLYAHGVVDNVDGKVDVAVPMYAKTLIEAFRPVINGEINHFVTAQDNVHNYAHAEGLDIQGMLEKYRAYVRLRGFRAFETDHLKEGAWHYSLDGFINFFIERLGGKTFVEVPSGRGRTDILILYQGYKYVIETKRFVDQSYFENGKYQLADYLRSEELDEGYYVVFSNKHTDKDKLYFDESIEGKRIHTYIILTNFERPSRRKAPKKEK